MSTPFFLELKKQASSFLQDKLRSARLALTDVTPVELLTEEATNESQRTPDPMTMGRISRAAFETDDYWRIVEVLHKRIENFDRKHWREAYNAVIILEHLLTHGPESVAEEFQSDREVILGLGRLEYVDDHGFNWGLTVKTKCERVLKLLEKGAVLKEERNRARKISRGIQGFGSFNISRPSTNDRVEEASRFYGRSTSLYEDYHQQEVAVSENENEDLTFDRADSQMKNSTDTERRLLKERSSSIGMATVKSLALEESKPLLAR